MFPSHGPGFRAMLFEFYREYGSLYKVSCKFVARALRTARTWNRSHGKDSICVAQAACPVAGAAGDVFGMHVTALDSP